MIKRSRGIGLRFVLLLPLLLVIDALVVEGVWLASRSSGYAGPKVGHRAGDPLNILDQRYAWGEITREEYQSMREDLARHPAE